MANILDVIGRTITAPISGLLRTPINNYADGVQNRITNQPTPQYNFPTNSNVLRPRPQMNIREQLKATNRAIFTDVWLNAMSDSEVNSRLEQHRNQQKQLAEKVAGDQRVQQYKSQNIAYADNVQREANQKAQQMNSWLVRHQNAMNEPAPNIDIKFQ